MLFWRKRKKFVNSVSKMSRKFLKYHKNENDALRGKRIVIEARKIGKVRVVSNRTSQHKGQRMTADNAVAWIERSYVAGKNL